MKHPSSSEAEFLKKLKVLQIKRDAKTMFAFVVAATACIFLWEGFPDSPSVEIFHAKVTNLSAAMNPQNITEVELLININFTLRILNDNLMSFKIHGYHYKILYHGMFLVGVAQRDEINVELQRNIPTSFVISTEFIVTPSWGSANIIELFGQDISQGVFPMVFTGYLDLSIWNLPQMRLHYSFNELMEPIPLLVEA